MAEFCLECWNKMNGFKADKRSFTISKDMYLCEGCGKWKPVIVIKQRDCYSNRINYYMLPFIAARFIFYLLVRLIQLLYLTLKRYIAKFKRS